MYLHKQADHPPGRRFTNEAKRFVRFGIVGLLGTITDLSVMLSLIKFVGIPPFLANVIGFIFAVIQNFILNRTFTFPEFKDRRMSEQVVKFIFVSLVGLTINMPIFILVDSYLRPSWTHWLSNSELGFNVSYQFAKLTAIAVVMLWNFTANRLWTFKSHI